MEETYSFKWFNWANWSSKVFFWWYYELMTGLSPFWDLSEEGIDIAGFSSPFVLIYRIIAAYLAMFSFWQVSWDLSLQQLRDVEVRNEDEESFLWFNEARPCFLSSYWKNLLSYIGICYFNIFCLSWRYPPSLAPRLLRVTGRLFWGLIDF